MGSMKMCLWGTDHERSGCFLNYRENRYNRKNYKSGFKVLNNIYDFVALLVAGLTVLQKVD